MGFIAAALLMGLLGSLHCVGMCGPIVMAVPFSTAAGNNRVLAALLYHIGRISVYGVIGLFFGLVGQSVVIAGYQQTLSVVMGALILLFVLLPKSLTNQINAAPFIARFTGKVKSRFNYFLARKGYSASLALGALNGLLPCGLVYVAVAAAIATGNVWKGSLFMLFFGVGTSPALLVLSTAPGFLKPDWRKNFRKAIPVVTILTAGLLILRGLNLGIPYISPSFSKTDCTKHQCCHKK